MYRILRSIKNRFGSTAELGIYEMLQNGLREVSNPSELLLTQDREGLSGVAISAAIEGIRPFLIEVQSLVSTAAYGTPQRSATGFDLRRMNMLGVISAVLSSNMDMAIERDIAMTGEVGLSGEIRPVTRVEQRILEAEKLGFKRILVPIHNLKGFDSKRLQIEITPVRKVDEAFRQLFG